MTQWQDDIRELEMAFEAASRDARRLASGLTEQQGSWRADAESGSIAQCLDHMATSTRGYLGAMRPPAEAALRSRRLRKGHASPGWFGRWLVWTLEPPVRRALRTRAPKLSQPRPAPSLQDAVPQFLASQQDAAVFLRQFAEIDLAGIRFDNPFVSGLRFSLATGLHMIAAHNRRHLWQGSRISREMMGFYAGDDAEAVHASRSHRDAGTHDWT